MSPFCHFVNISGWICSQREHIEAPNSCASHALCVVFPRQTDCPCPRWCQRHVLGRMPHTLARPHLRFTSPAFSASGVARHTRVCIKLPPRRHKVLRPCPPQSGHFRRALRRIVLATPTNFVATPFPSAPSHLARRYLCPRKKCLTEPSKKGSVLIFKTPLSALQVAVGIALGLTR